MTELDHLLVCLNEECVEIAKEIDKALRFGLDDEYPADPEGRTNRKRIWDELHDLYGVLELLTALNVLPAVKDRARIRR